MCVSSAENTLDKTMTLADFFAFIVPKIGCFSTNFFFVCDTCDSKKTKPLLEGARALRACVRARADASLSTALPL